MIDLVFAFYFYDKKGNFCFYNKIRNVMLSPVINYIEFILCRSKPIDDRLIIFQNSCQYKFRIAVKFCRREYPFFDSVKKYGFYIILITFIKIYSFFPSVGLWQIISTCSCYRILNEAIFAVEMIIL